MRQTIRAHEVHFGPSTTQNLYVLAQAFHRSELTRGISTENALHCNAATISFRHRLIYPMTSPNVTIPANI